MSKRNRMTGDNSTRNFLLILGGMMAAIVFCVGSIILGSFWLASRGPDVLFSGESGASQQPATWAADSAELTVRLTRHGPGLCAVGRAVQCAKVDHP